MASTESIPESCLPGLPDRAIARIGGAAMGDKSPKNKEKRKPKKAKAVAK